MDLRLRILGTLKLAPRSAKDMATAFDVPYKQVLNTIEDLVAEGRVTRCFSLRRMTLKPYRLAKPGEACRMHDYVVERPRDAEPIKPILADRGKPPVHPHAYLMGPETDAMPIVASDGTSPEWGLTAARRARAGKASVR